MKKSKSETGSPKRSKKSCRKKKKKRKKKSEGEKRKKAESSSSSEDTCASKGRQRRKKRKSPCKNHKYAKESQRAEESSSEDSSGEERERRTSNHKKRKQDSRRDSDSGLNAKKSRRNWKEADEESSRDSADWGGSGNQQAIQVQTLVVFALTSDGLALQGCSVCLASTKPKQPFSTPAQSPLQSLDAARTPWWGILGVLPHTSWGNLSGASLIPSTLLSISLTKRLLKMFGILYLRDRATFL